MITGGHCEADKNHLWTMSSLILFYRHHLLLMSVRLSAADRVKNGKKYYNEAEIEERTWNTESDLLVKLPATVLLMKGIS